MCSITVVESKNQILVVCGWTSFFNLNIAVVAGGKQTGRKDPNRLTFFFSGFVSWIKALEFQLNHPILQWENPPKFFRYFLSKFIFGNQIRGVKNGKYIVGLCRSPRKKSHCGKIQPKPRKPLVLGGPTALSECRLEYNWVILGWKHHGILVASQPAVGGGGCQLACWGEGYHDGDIPYKFDYYTCHSVVHSK